MPALADDREEVDNSTEGIVQDLQVLPNLMDQNVGSGEAPTTLHTLLCGKFSRLKWGWAKRHFWEKVLSRDQLYSKSIINETTQAGEQLKAIMTQTKIVESSEDTMNVKGRMRKYLRPLKRCLKLLHIHQWIFWLNYKYPRKGSIRYWNKKDDVRELQHSTSVKGDEFETEQEEKAARYFENPFQKRLQRCPPSFLQEIESQEVEEGDSCGCVSFQVPSTHSDLV